MQENHKQLLLGIWFYVFRVSMLLASMFVVYALLGDAISSTPSKPIPIYSDVTVTECYIKLKDNAEPSQFCRYEGDSNLKEREYNYDAYQREKVFVGQEVKRQTGERNGWLVLGARLVMMLIMTLGVIVVGKELLDGRTKVLDKKRRSEKEKCHY